MSNPRIAETACVSSTATICDFAAVWGGARVVGSARVEGWAKIADSAYVWGNARIGGSATVRGLADVGGNAHVTGSAEVSGLACVRGNARLQREDDVLHGISLWAWTAYPAAPDAETEEADHLVLQYGCETHPLARWTPEFIEERATYHQESEAAQDITRIVATVRAYFAGRFDA